MSGVSVVSSMASTCEAVDTPILSKRSQKRSSSQGPSASAGLACRVCEQRQMASICTAGI